MQRVAGFRIQVGAVGWLPLRKGNRMMDGLMVGAVVMGSMTVGMADVESAVAWVAMGMFSLMEIMGIVFLRTIYSNHLPCSGHQM